MNLIKSTGTFGFYTIISRLLGYLRDILIAIFLGASSLADVFFVAFRIPNTFRRLFAEGTFNAAFVPSYTSELSKSKTKANKFADQIFNLLFLGLLILVLVIELFMPIFISLIAPGFVGDVKKIELAITLTRITFPFLMFVCLASFFSAILNSHNKFAAASAAPIILNLVLIGILSFSKIIDDKLVYYLSYGVSIAGLLQIIFLYKFVRNFYLVKFDLRFKITKQVNFFFKKLLPSIFSSGVTQINILIGTIIASFQAGAVSYLYYADRIYQINLAIAGIAIGTVILPKLSSYIAQKKLKDVDLIQNKSLELSLFLSLPAMAGLLIASEEIVSSLFGYGSFNKEGVENSAKALFYFALGLPAFSLIKILSNFVFARDNTKIPFYFSLISVIINASISIYYFRDFGFIIIPIATSISSWINALLLYYYLSHKKFFKVSLSLIFQFFKISFSVLLMALFLFSSINFFSVQLEYDSNFKVVYLLLLVISSAIIYFAISLLTKAFKLSDIKIRY